MHCHEFFFCGLKTDWICLFQYGFAQEWMRLVVFDMVPCLSCLVCACVRVIFMKWTAAIIVNSEPAPDPPPLSISSCEKTQFCLCLPKKKNVMKCKPVAPPHSRPSPATAASTCTEVKGSVGKHASFKHDLNVCGLSLLYPPLAWD